MRRKQKKIEQEKIDQSEKKLSYSKEVVLLIAAIVSLLIVVLTLVDKCALPDPKPESDRNPGFEPEPDPQIGEKPSVVSPEFVPVAPPPVIVVVPPPQPPAVPPPPPKTETIRLTVTQTETASESVFDGDVQITLTKVIDTYQQVFGKIIVTSSGGPPRAFEELTPFDPQKIGNYEINVVKIGHDYADFRIVRRQR